MTRNSTERNTHTAACSRHRTKPGFLWTLKPGHFFTSETWVFMSKSPAVITLTMHTLPPSYTETVPHAAKLGLATMLRA